MSEVAGRPCPLSVVALQVIELARAGASLDLEIFAAKEKIGTLIVGRGSLYWYGSHRQKRKLISWTRLAGMMDELAYGPT
jgi:hypothetical protein